MNPGLIIIGLIILVILIVDVIVSVIAIRDAVKTDQLPWGNYKND